MGTARLLMYVVGILLAITGLAMLYISVAPAIALLSLSAILLTFLGWRNVGYALLVGIVAGNPTENIPEGEGE